MSEQGTSEEIADGGDGAILSIKSEDWSSVEFYVSTNDGELNIEIKDAEETWLTIKEAILLRDFLNSKYP